MNLHGLRSLFFSTAFFFWATTVFAQPLSPVVVRYQCRFDPWMSSSGQMHSICYPPALPDRDGYLCYYSTAFDSEFGNIGVGVSLLLPVSTFGPHARIEEVCLRTSGVGYEGDLGGP